MVSGALTRSLLDLKLASSSTVPAAEPRRHRGTDRLRLHHRPGRTQATGQPAGFACPAGSGTSTRWLDPGACVPGRGRAGGPGIRGRGVEVLSLLLLRDRPDRPRAAPWDPDPARR